MTRTDFIALASAIEAHEREQTEAFMKRFNLFRTGRYPPLDNDDREIVRIFMESTPG